MNDEKNWLWPIFGATLILFLALPSISPDWHLQVFSPFLVLVIYKKPFVKALIVAFMVGFLRDLFNSSPYIGIDALACVLAALIIYPLKVRLFLDRIFTLPIATFILSSLVTLFSMWILNTLDQSLKISGPWVWNEVFVWPFYDGVYAFICLVLPTLLLGKPVRPSRDYFLNSRLHSTRMQ